MDLNTSEWNVTVRSILTAGLVDLLNFMFSDRYHLTASALTRVCPSMTGVMLWIASFNRCRMSLLLLLLNAFLKVRAVYFKADSTISGAFQCSACSAGAQPTCTFFTINFLGVEGPFSNAVSAILGRSFIWEKSGTPLAFVFGSFNQTFHWLLNLLHLLISRCKHGFELIVG